MDNILYYRTQIDELKRLKGLFAVVTVTGLQSLLAIEVKLSPAIHPDFFKGLKYFRSLFEKEIQSTMVVYTGVSGPPDDRLTGYFNPREMSNLSGF